MPDQTKTAFVSSPLRRLLWTVAMLVLFVGAGVILWRAYQARQAAILAEGETPRPVQGPVSPSPPGAGEPAAPETPAASSVPSEEFVPRADTSVEFPPPPASLDESDAWLRQQLPLADQNPGLARWLDETSDLLRKFVVLVNEIAQGRVPRQLFAFWAPKAPFPAKRTGSGYIMDPAGYHRYDGLAAAVDGLDIDLAWRLYQQLKPLIDEVYAEFGRPGTQFDQVLLAAVEHLLRTPQPNGTIRLVKPSVMYKYADPQLESLSAAQKQLLRMGPVNAAIVKHKLGLLRGLLLGQPQPPSP